MIENSELVEIIHRAPLFMALDDDSASALRKSMDEVRLTRGQTLFSEGDQAERLYVIGEGKIKLGTVSADGRENLLSILGPGDMFGELSLFDLKPRASTASAVTDARLFSLGNDYLRELLRVRPEVSFYLLQSLAQRFRRVSEIVEDLVFSDVPGRVAKALIQLSGRFGKPTDEGLHVNNDLTQEELAQLVGASRETVNKALADFAGRGWLRLEARSVIILDEERLSKRAR